MIPMLQRERECVCVCARQGAHSYDRKSIIILCSLKWNVFLAIGTFLFIAIALKMAKFTHITSVRIEKHTHTHNLRALSISLAFIPAVPVVVIVIVIVDATGTMHTMVLVASLCGEKVS